VNDSQYTPGPWHVDGTPGYEALEVVARGRRVARALYGHGSEDNEADANARLIAAAPDLLAALEAVEWARTCETATHPVTGEIAYIYPTICPWCKARMQMGHYDDCQRQAAIAKARGE